jgi:hypothetical protein
LRARAQPSVTVQIDHALTIDRAAAPSRPDDQAISDWAEEQRVFVSSVIDGYEDYRRAAVGAIEHVGAHAVWFEDFGGRDSDPNQAYLSEVRSSTIYAGLLGARYGKPLADRYSATHQEFREAERSGLRTTVWAQEPVEREGPQQSFLEEVRVFQVTGSYSTPDELRERLIKRLREIAAEDLSPWVKLGGLVFRATEVVERRGGIRLRASVRDPQVVAAIRSLNDGWTNAQRLFTYGDRAAVVSVESVTATTRAGRAVEFEVELRMTDPPSPTRVSFNGVDWPQLTKQAIEVSLFGKENPLGLMRHMAELANPFPHLRSEGVAEESLRPIARLLLTEILVIERGIERITSFQLGPDRAGIRRLRLAWQEPRPYTNSPPPPPMEVVGDVKL